jgi:hypothetical protein
LLGDKRWCRLNSNNRHNNKAKHRCPKTSFRPWVLRHRRFHANGKRLLQPPLLEPPAEAMEAMEACQGNLRFLKILEKTKKLFIYMLKGLKKLFFYMLKGLKINYRFLKIYYRFFK